jgi:hypothetical protein
VAPVVDIAKDFVQSCGMNELRSSGQKTSSRCAKDVF